MSFLSRLFRKAPSVSPDSVSATKTAPSKPVEPARPTPGAADRALAAAAEESALQSALDSRDIQALARLVVAGASTKTRQAAAAAIEDPELLRQLIRDVRGGNDKKVYKVLTGKRDVLLDQARKLEQLQAEIHAVADALERLSQRPYDSLSGPKLEQWESRWKAVAAEADAEQRGRVQQWIDRSRETIAEHLRQVAAQASREQAAADAAEAARRLRDEEAQASAAAEAERARMIEEQKREQVEKQNVEQQAARQIGELIRKARAALRDGGTSRAASVRRVIDEKLAGAPPLPENLAGQLQLLDKQLDELKDWKSFSVTPKRAELIEKMESLVGASLDPLALADRIKALQDEWRILGKGAGENLEADGQRFLEAAQKAYQPCAEYFAAQALVREENLRRRDALLAQLTAFDSGMNWEQPDWRAVIKTLREAKQAWRSCSPVDPSAAVQQQNAFAALNASLQGRLDAEYARNLKHKESLIERARQALASDESRKAIEAIKELQQKWRTVGPVPREVDQRLWEQFRERCDAVFQQREQESSTYLATLEHNKTQAIAICEQIEQIAALEGTELLARAGERVELRNAFDALGDFPRADARVLRDRLARSLDRCEQSLARQHARDVARSWKDLFEAAKHVRAYRLAATRGVDAPVLDRLKESADAYIASVQRWPKGGLEALKQGLAGERSADLAANEAALRMLCIRAELLTDLPTPPEDQPLRRDYQLQRLVQSMGQGVRADDAQLDAMGIEWVTVGPVEDEISERLMERFRRCLERRHPETHRSNDRSS